MNDQFREMVTFQRSLRQFNERLQASVAELQHRHDYVDPHWHDDMRQRYDQEWAPFKANMTSYLRHDQQRYDEFLSSKIQALRRYLYGG